MKRFVATERWDKPWFRKLSPRLKCFWDYLCERCDPIGIWEPDFEMASLYIGEQVSEKDLIIFEDRVEKLPCGKIWLTGFCDFQYGTLSLECRAHTKLIERLAYRKLLDKVSHRVSDTHKEKEQDKEKEKEEGIVRGEIARNKLFASTPSEKEVLAYAQMIGLMEWKALDWFHEEESCGWLDYAKRPISNWQAAITRVRTKWEADGRPKGPPSSQPTQPKLSREEENRKMLEDARS